MKSVFITGAGRGLGAYVSECLLKDNWRVFGASRGGDFPNTLADHPNFHGLSLDITNAEECEKSIMSAIEAVGPIDALINNASGNLWGELIGGYEGEDIQREVLTTLVGPMLVSNAFVRLNNAAVHNATQNLDSRVISISSIAGHLGAAGGGSSIVYSAAKSGIIRFTECANDQKHKHGHTFYTLVPDNVRAKNFIEEAAVSYNDVCDAIKFLLSESDNLLVDTMVLRPKNIA